MVTIRAEKLEPFERIGKNRFEAVCSAIIALIFGKYIIVTGQKVPDVIFQSL